MKILSVSDIEMGFLYSPRIADRFHDVDIIIGCGDLPYYYLEYMISILNIPLYYVRGNHSPLVESGFGGDRKSPWGAVDLHRRVIQDDTGLLLAGIEGSLKYNNGPHQYTQGEMWGMIWMMVPRLFLNYLLYGRYLDIFITHAPPYHIHDSDDLPHQGIKAYNWLIKVFQPTLHLHGHIHLYTQNIVPLTRVKHTQVINSYGYREILFTLPIHRGDTSQAQIRIAAKEVVMASDAPPPIRKMASDDFNIAIRKGFWRSVVSWLKRKDNYLLPFDEYRKRLPFASEHYIGMRQIPLDRIVGSVGRYQDFDSVFLPRHERIRPRWESIDTAHLQDLILPPIEVYKISEIYFVRDGNHRVSVARERGQKFIDALVIEIDVPIPVDETTNLDDLILSHEHLMFMQDTRLSNLRPEASIQLTLPGVYTQLLDHIRTHQWFMGENRNQEVSWEDAVVSWYDEVYMPLIRVIREQKVLESFPERTETDLYLWIIEYLWYLREELQEVSLEEAAQQFTDTYAAKPANRLFRVLENIVRIYPEDEPIPPEDDR